MIPLQEIYDYLGSAELSNLFIADGGLGTGLLKPEYHDVVNRSIYLGLTDLHTRFDLKVREFTFNNLGQSRLIHKYVFPIGDCVEVLQVFVDRVELETKTLNGYTLTDVNVVKLNSEHGFNSTLKVVYRANHEAITPTTTSIMLPRPYLMALLYFIASRLFTSIPNQLDGDLNEGNRYAQKYAQEIAKLHDEGLDINLDDDMWLFNQKGFI